jgi:hypothetical protein
MTPKDFPGRGRPNQGEAGAPPSQFLVGEPETFGQTFFRPLSQSKLGEEILEARDG